MAGNELDKRDENAEKKMKNLGGIKALPFILATEVCERFAEVGFHGNLITYLTQSLHLPLVQAANIVTNCKGTASLTPLLGGIIADSFAGRFWTILVGSIFYDLGLLFITVTAILPMFQPPPCPTQENCTEASTLQLGVFYVCLLFIVLGTGGIRPNVVTFGADQFDMTKSKVESRSWNYFNWYFFVLGMATLTSLTVVVYVQDNVGWGWGLGIPTISMAIAVIIFIVGCPLYKKVKPPGSPLIRWAQVVAAAVKKRKAVVLSDSNMLYQNMELDKAISTNGRLLHTDKFKWLDKAATVSEEESRDLSHPDLWRLATVHRVEEVKSTIRVLPIWAAGIVVVIASAHKHSFAIQQARSMDRHLTSYLEIPPASLTLFTIVARQISLVIYERLIVPFVRRFTGRPTGLTTLQRTGIGYGINTLSTMAAALAEIRRKQVAAEHNLLDSPESIIPISVWWLVPQYWLHGVAEAFYSVGYLEFLYDQLPESMRSIAAALYWISISIGNYLNTFLVLAIHKYTGKSSNWLPDRNLNRGKLDYFYWLISGIQVLNLVYFVISAWLYTYKTITEVEDVGDQDDVESADNSDVARESLLAKVRRFGSRKRYSELGLDSELHSELGSDLISRK
ncbi:Proton-dependent oligopeptide transporter family [Dillenia turbinata]|uniref:Proton-dependent oligopeptide transporter family n=1 Tax=Dillenia turbinata TaxID=194707 RepID=A0AAN8YXZ6_9MAGN